MLEELHVRDLALIEDVWLEFGPGMTVLSGETGAGKTAVVGALKLLLGDRADSSAVRSGASEALVEGRFRIGGAEVLANRRVSAEGRSRATLDGEMATVGALASRLGPLVDLHGQHDHQALLSPASHVGYLDRWAADSVTPALAAYTRAREAWEHARRDRDELERRLDEASRNADYLRFVADEIGRVDPQPGEDEQLRSRLPALQHGEKLAAAASDATALLRGEGGALDGIGAARAALVKTSGLDPVLDELAEQLAGIEALSDDVSSSLRAYRDGIEHDPRALDEALARLSAIAGLTKKYGPTLDEVLRRRDEACAALAATDDGQARLDAARAVVDEAESGLRQAADALGDARRVAAPGFTRLLAERCADLAMPDAAFEVGFTELPFEAWTAEGPDRIEFLYAPTTGQEPRPLSRIASGGELSRVMLALKGVLGEADEVTTLVFDEIDAGIGGATAHAVGRRLAELARAHQVIVVTHLAQVAAFADAHVVVEKQAQDGRARTVARAVFGDERIGELARMLSGTDSEAGRAHAVELLAEVEAAP